MQIQRTTKMDEATSIHFMQLLCVGINTNIFVHCLQIRMNMSTGWQTLYWLSPYFGWVVSLKDSCKKVNCLWVVDPFRKRESLPAGIISRCLKIASLSTLSNTTFPLWNSEQEKRNISRALAVVEYAICMPICTFASHFSQILFIQFFVFAVSVIWTG